MPGHLSGAYTLHPACFSCASAASLVDCAAQQRLQPAVMPHLQMALGLLWRRLLTLCLTARSLGSSTCDWLWRGRHGTSRVTRHAPSTVACRGACAAGEAHAVGKNDTVLVVLCGLLRGGGPGAAQVARRDLCCGAWSMSYFAGILRLCCAAVHDAVAARG